MSRYKSGYLILAWFVSLLVLERQYRLRKPAGAPALRRVSTNLALAGATAATITLAERPLVARLAQRVDRKATGLLPGLGLPSAVEAVLALVMLDLSLYWWHILLHRVPMLWRFHVVHHSDRELDVSTALRFHFGEFLASIPWRCAQVLLIGVRPRVLALWQRLTLIEVMFHHANLRLPDPMERALRKLLVTPDMHGIHHSMVPEETGSNFSSGLTLWDVIHGTYRHDIPQKAITIGVPAYSKATHIPLPDLLAMPERSQRDYWRLPDGTLPHR